MKLICGIPTKNEEWIIGKTLSVLTRFCDKIIILDDNSTDKTEEICKSFEKVEFIKININTKKNTWTFRQNKLFNEVKKYIPKYILILDADEIPTPSFITFFNTIDTSVNCWCVRFINLFKDEKHYRGDRFITKTGVNVCNDPFYKNGWRKYILLKYDKNYDYTYNLNILKQNSGKRHPMPENIPEPIKNTEDFFIIHYGKLDKKYTSGEKDIRYAKIETAAGQPYTQRLMHHYLCRTGSGPNGPEYKECKKEWFCED